jgi:hypothetical protein
MLKRKVPSIHPYFKIKREWGQVAGIPVLMTDTFLQPFRKFCCLVVVESKQQIWCGSGTLIDVGIVSARHIFNQKTQITEKWAAFLLENNEWVTVDLGNVIFEDKDRDIIVLARPLLSSYFKPAKIGWNIKELIFTPENSFAFGCPIGLLGKVWQPRFIGISETKIYTKGFACPGVSGGGIFTNNNDEWFLWAIHSEFYLPSYTLLSSIINIKA